MRTSARRGSKSASTSATAGKGRGAAAASKERRAPLAPHVHLSIGVDGGAYAGRILRAKAAEFLEKLGKSRAELSILLTTDGGIRKLNRRFRGKNKPTDVLSFPAGDEGPLPPGMPRPLGDLAISLDTARRRAAEDGRSLSFELSRYLAHGILHLLGYDHEVSPAEARRMARAEARLLGVPGMLDDAQGMGPDPLQRAPGRVEGRPGAGRPGKRRGP